MPSRVLASRLAKSLFVLSICLLAGNCVVKSARAEPFSNAVNADWPPFSYTVDGKAQGVLVDLLTEIIGEQMQEPIRFTALPWKRAQYHVEMGTDDALLTFPSEDRKEYAFSSRNVVYELEAHAFVQRGSPEAVFQANDRAGKHCKP